MNFIYRFIISQNEYLKKDITGYFHQFYVGFKQPGNPDFLNILKNTFNRESKEILVDAMNKVIDILKQDIPNIIKKENMSNTLCVCVPRAKALDYYRESQLMFKEAVKIAIKNIKNVSDGTDCIIRFKNTKTTHLAKANIINDGDEPYPGITINTCKINRNKIMNRNIILIDDIYTRGINIDEDCIQALIDNGAKNIIFYAIGYTRRF